MNNKRLITALLSAVMLSTSVVSQTFARYEDLPEPEYSGAGGQEDAYVPGWTPTNQKYLFTVEGKSFILLDKDDEGNYFVLAEDEYGKHAVDTSFVNQPIIESKDGSGGFIKGNAFDLITDDKEWMYSIEDPTNIGYWLNNDFYNNGNGGDYKLPESIKNNIIEKEWYVEGLKTALDWTASDKYDKERAQAFAAERTSPGYTVGGKLSLMSYTEYKKYRGILEPTSDGKYTCVENIIGFMHCDKGWNGFILRTPHALLTSSDGINLKYAYGGLQVRNQGNQQAGTGKNMIITVIDAPVPSDNFYVRPVMWLSKDFFKNVKVDLSTVGSIPKAEILKNSVQELSALYSVEELAEFGKTLEDTETISELTVMGTPAVGSQLYANYGFNEENGYDEDNSEIVWLASDSEGAEYKPTEYNGKKLLLDDTLMGKSLMCAVATKDENGIIKGIYMSDSASAVKEAAETILINDMDITDTQATVSIINPTAEDKSAKLIKTVYDENNQLVLADVHEVLVAAGESVSEVMEISEADGAKAQIMVWTDGNQPLFYLTK